MAPVSGVVRVLHVDDDPDIRELTASYLEKEDGRISVETAGDADEGLERLDDGEFDCVVSDYEMPGVDGIRFLESVRDEHGDLPFILFTGRGGEEVASDAISAGVTDYLQKEMGTGQYAVLANRIVNVVEQYRAKREAERTERMLSEIAGRTDDILFMFDGDWDELLFVNSAYEEVWGASVEELREDPYSFVEYIHPDDREKAYRSMEKIADGEPDEIEYRVRPPDCDERWVYGQTKPIEDDDGNVVRIAGYVRDITRHKEREEELERMNRRYRTLVDSFPEGGVFLYDHDLRYVVAGGEALRQTGFSPEEMEGKTLEEVFPEEVVEVQREKYEAALDGEPQVFEQEFHGRWFRLHVLPVTDDDGDVMSGMVVSQDVTERKEREKRLRQAREKYHELFNSMNDTAWVIGTDGGILDVNDAAVDVLGYSRDELRSMKVHEVDPVFDESEGDSLVERLMEEDETVFETVHETKDGERIPVEISSSPITYDGETAILSIGRDISDREERRKRLKEVASVVSHDLRNPLNVAQARLELAREEGDDEHFDAVEDALGRMERMVDDVLTLARMGGEAEETEWVNLETVVTESWRSVEAPDATVTVEDDITVDADRGRLQRLLENLFGNAVEHGSASGDVTVTVGGHAEGFYVEDDGVGVPPEERDEVFSVGYSTTSDGTGFGLATVEQVAEAHGWNVRLTDGDDGGARFEFRGVRTDGG